MDAVVKALQGVLLSYGLPGVVILALGVWVWKLQTLLNEVQEQRVKDVFRMAQMTNACARALERNTTIMKALLEG